MNAQEIIRELQKHHDPQNIAGMQRFGITGKNIIGGPGIPCLRAMAKTIGRNHTLAQALWDSEIHEARILAGMIDDPQQVTRTQMNAWVKGFDSWDLCDQTCVWFLISRAMFER